MTDGPTEATDLDKTEANKALMRTYMDDLLNGRRETFPNYFDGNRYIQHNPWVGDNLSGLAATYKALGKQGAYLILAGQALAVTRVHVRDCLTVLSDRQRQRVRRIAERRVRRRPRGNQDDVLLRHLGPGQQLEGARPRRLANARGQP